MFGQTVRIAQEKATSAAERQALTALAGIADSYDQAERDFPRLMAEQQARRGATPPKLSKACKASLEDFAVDQEALLTDLREQYSSCQSPREIVASLALALENDIPMSASLVKYAAPEDRPLVEARVERQRMLLDALRDCQASLRNVGAA